MFAVDEVEEDAEAEAGAVDERAANSELPSISRTFHGASEPLAKGNLAEDIGKH